MLSEPVDSAQLKELASNSADLDLCLSVADLARLSACTYRKASSQDNGEQAELTVKLKFDFGPEDFSRVGLSITGCLNLKCQRCLEPLTWPVQIETRLTMLDSDVQTELLESPFDSVLIGVDGLDLVSVIEDEILAALPMVPIHSDESPCQPTGGDDGLIIDAELTQRPFADLVSLMGNRKRNTDH
jgi:uncharacterized protein